MKKIWFMIAAAAFVVVGCTTEAEGTAVKAAEATVTVTQAAPPPPVTVTQTAPAPAPRTLRQKLVAIPGVSAEQADVVIQIQAENPQYEAAIRDGCEMGLTREYFVETAMGGATEDGPVSAGDAEVLASVFGTLWDHYCPGV